MLTVHFQKTAPSQWSYSVSVPGEDTAGGTAGTPVDIGASGTLTFGADGQLTDPAVGSTIGLDVTGLSSGGADMHLDWNPRTDLGAGRITQFGQPSAPSASSQNGSAAAQLIRVGLADGGQMLAQYSDGQQVVVGQVAMASVRNPESLIAAGNNNYQVSARTATPAIGLPNHWRPRRYCGRRDRSLHGGYRQGVYQPDRAAARVSGKFACDHHRG